MTSTTTSATDPTATSTCPCWCNTSSEHLRWDCSAPWPQTGEVRWHGQRIGEHVAVWGTEHRHAEHGPVTLDTPVVNIYDVEGVDFTATQARQHAAAVLAAVDLLDRVVAGR